MFLHSKASVIHSVHRGGLQRTPPLPGRPPDQGEPPRTKETTPGTRENPPGPGRTLPPRTSGEPFANQGEPPRTKETPLGPGRTPPRLKEAPLGPGRTPPGSRLQHTVYERPVHIPTGMHSCYTWNFCCFHIVKPDANISIVANFKPFLDVRMS